MLDLLTYIHIHPFNGPFSGTTPVSRYQKGKTNRDFTEAKDSEWQWHQLGHMQVCTSLQTDNHASTPPLSFLQAGCPSCRPTNSVKALKAWCWTFLQSDFNLRRPHIARQQQLSVYIVPRPTSAANPPAAAAAVDRRDRQTDGRTDGHATVLGRLRILCRPRYNQLISVFFTESRARLIIE